MYIRQAVLFVLNRVCVARCSPSIWGLLLDPAENRSIAKTAKEFLDHYFQRLVFAFLSGTLPIPCASFYCSCFLLDVWLCRHLQRACCVWAWHFKVTQGKTWNLHYCPRTTREWEVGSTVFLCVHVVEHEIHMCTCMHRNHMCTV